MELLDQVQELLATLQPGITQIGALIFAAGVVIEVIRATNRQPSARLPRKVHREVVETLGQEPPTITHNGRPGRSLMQLGLVIAALHPLVYAFSYVLDSLV